MRCKHPVSCCGCASRACKFSKPVRTLSRATVERRYAQGTQDVQARAAQTNSAWTRSALEYSRLCGTFRCKEVKRVQASIGAGHEHKPLRDAQLVYTLSLTHITIMRRNKNGTHLIAYRAHTICAKNRTYRCIFAHSSSERPKVGAKRTHL